MIYSVFLNSKIHDDAHDYHTAMCLSAKSDTRRYAALCILAQIGRSIPNLFFDLVIAGSYSIKIFDAIMTALQDSKVEVAIPLIFLSLSLVYVLLYLSLVNVS